MEWVGLVRGKTVGLDTAPIIYFIERNPLYVDMMRSFFQAVQKNECAVVTSTITLLETLVVPLRQGNITNDSRLPSLQNLKTLVLDDLKKGSEG